MKQVLFASALALGFGMIAGCSSATTQDPGLVNPGNNPQGAAALYRKIIALVPNSSQAYLRLREERRRHLLPHR